MKNKIFIPLLALIAVLFTALTDGTGISVKIKKGNFSINGQKVSDDWALNKFTGALGLPDSTRLGYNKTHTYHSNGIVLFETSPNKIPSGNVAEIQFYFSDIAKNEVSPKNIFVGSVKIDKLNVDASLTYVTLKEKLSKWKTTTSYLSHSYRYSNKGIYIYFQFNETEDRLQKISIGKDNSGN